MLTTGSSTHPAQRQRYVTLDGLRGAAALMVVLFHSGHGLGTWMPRFSYLAVDLFFLLSGFVLATKYEPRFQRGLTTSEFFIARVVRLYPLYLLGLILGVCFAQFGPDIRGLTAEAVRLASYSGSPAYPPMFCIMADPIYLRSTHPSGRCSLNSGLPMSFLFSSGTL